jgi:glycosyltransferase involved in cell wall biosynthesis
LGKACQGLAQAMAKQGAQVFFVLPTFPERVSEKYLEVVGARECVIEAGWDPEKDIFRPTLKEQVTGEWSPIEANLSMIRSEAQLFPYGAHPEEKMTQNLKQILDRVSGVEPILGVSGPEVQPAPQIRTLEQKIVTTKVVTTTQVTQEIYGRNLWSEIERFCYTVRHLADAHEVDLVHAHDWMTFPAAFEFQRMTGVPVYLHVHATEYDRSGDNLNHEVFRIERDGFRRASHIFAVSKYTAGIIERLYGVNRKKISVVYNAPEEDSKSLLPTNGGERRPQVVFLGRLTFQKGPDHFLKAAALVKDANPNARFILCGTGDMMDKLRNQAHRLGLENNVHFAGFVDPMGVDEILQHSRVLVMPSVSEPFGLVALEAIRCGIPVILSKQSGVREVLNRALQVDFWDHEKLADQILAALRLKGLSQQLVEEGLTQMQQLSWEKSAKQVIEVYRRYIGSTYAQAIGGAHGH